MKSSSTKIVTSRTTSSPTTLLSFLLDLQFGAREVIEELENYWGKELNLKHFLCIQTESNGRFSSYLSCRSTILENLYAYQLRETEVGAQILTFITKASHNENLLTQNMSDYYNSDFYVQTISPLGLEHLLLKCVVMPNKVRLIFLMAKQATEKFSDEEIQVVDEWSQTLSAYQLKEQPRYNYTWIVKKTGLIVLKNSVLTPLSEEAALLLKLISNENPSSYPHLATGRVQNQWGMFSTENFQSSSQQFEGTFVKISQLECYEMLSLRGLIELGFSFQQVKFLWLLLQGLSRKEISQILKLSTNTINTVIKRCYQKIQVDRLSDIHLMILKHYSPREESTDTDPVENNYLNPN